jgi:streptogramin lyase
VTTYTLPADTKPVMIALDGGQVWYTDSSNGAVGRLDPNVAPSTSSVVISTTTPVTPNCPADPLVGITSDASTRTGTLVWSSNTYTQTASGGGLAVYQMPEGAHPWGVAWSDGQVWVVDQGHQVLGRFSPETRVYLPLMVQP